MIFCFMYRIDTNDIFGDITPEQLTFPVFPLRFLSIRQAAGLEKNTP